MDWSDYFANIAVAAALKSKDPSTRVGACIADANHALVSVGYNGPPRTCDDSLVPWTRPEKYPWIVHAELNAILFAVAAKGAYELNGCVLYTSGTVCSKCLLIAAHVGLKRIVCGVTRPACCDAADRAVAEAIAAACGVRVEW